MTTASFNLVDEPWLPVTLCNGFPGRGDRGAAPRVSLREAFERGEQICDLRCYPHERIALMRLLICIAQRALDGPKTEDEWKECKSRLPRAAVDYLDESRRCFNLLGDGPRFLQARGLRTVGDKSGLIPVDKLDLGAAAGNTPTLFDNAGGTGHRYSLQELAVMLVTYQVCSPGGLIGIALWNGVKTGETKASRHALGARNSAVHGFVLGKSLLDHLYLNLMSHEGLARWGRAGTGSEIWGSPVWERPPSNSQDDVGYNSYLSRLVPFSRAVWLSARTGTAIVANGLNYDFFPVGPRDPTITVTLRDDGCLPLRGRVDKAMWRELHSIASSPVGTPARGPLALGHTAGTESDLRLWAGAVLTVKDSDAKIIDSIEGVFRLPASFLDGQVEAEVDDFRVRPNMNNTYRQGVEFADRWAGRLRAAVYRYHLRLSDDFRKAQNAKRGRGLQTQAATRYWTALEQEAERVLLRDVAVHSERYWRQGSEWMAKSPWGREVIRAAREAYEFACPHTTPRQLRAYADGLRALLGDDGGKGSRKKRSPRKPDVAEDAQ